MRYGIILLLMLLLAACKTDITGILYVRDVRECMTGAEALYETRGKIKIAVSSEEKKDEYVTLLGRYFKTITNPKITSEEYGSYLSADITIPVEKVKEGHFTGDDQSLVSLLLEEEADGYYAGYYFDKELFHELDAYMYDTYMQHMDLKELTFYLVINNDTKSAYTLYPQFLYVNGTPVLDGEPCLLQPREEVTLQVADVMKDYICAEGNYLFVRMDK